MKPYSPDESKIFQCIRIIVTHKVNVGYSRILIIYVEMLLGQGTLTAREWLPLTICHSWIVQCQSYSINVN